MMQKDGPLQARRRTYYVGGGPLKCKLLTPEQIYGGKSPDCQERGALEHTDCRSPAGRSLRKWHQVTHTRDSILNRNRGEASLQVRNCASQAGANPLLLSLK